MAEQQPTRGGVAGQRRRPLNRLWCEARLRARWSVRRIARESGFSRHLVEARLTEWGYLPSPLPPDVTETAVALWQGHHYLREIALVLLVPVDQVRLALIAGGAKPGKRGSRSKLDRRWATAAYVDELMTVRQIAEKAGVAPVTVRKALKAAGVELRDDSRVQDPRMVALLSEEYLRDRLIERWWTYAQVVEETGADYNLVCRRAAQFGMVRRMPLDDATSRKAVRLYTREHRTVAEVCLELGRGYQAVTMALAAARVLRSAGGIRKNVHGRKPATRANTPGADADPM